MNKNRLLPAIIVLFISMGLFIIYSLLNDSSSPLNNMSVFNRSLLQFSMDVKPTQIREIGPQEKGLRINKFDKSIVKFTYKNTSKQDLTGVQLEIGFYEKNSKEPKIDYFGVNPLSDLKINTSGLRSKKFVVDLPGIRAGETKQFDDIFFFGRTPGKGTIKATITSSQGLTASDKSGQITISGLYTNIPITNDSVFLTDNVTADINVTSPTIKAVKNSEPLDNTNRAKINIIVKNNTTQDLKNMKVLLRMASNTNYEVSDTKTAQLNKSESKPGFMIFSTDDVKAKSFSIFHLYLSSKSPRSDNIQVQVTGNPNVSMTLPSVGITVQ